MVLYLLIAGLLTERAYAQSPYFSLYCQALGTYCGDGAAFIAHVAVRTADVLVLPVIGGIAVIGILWASIKLTSSFGDDQGKEEAKKIIIGTVVGIALAVVGVAVVHWVCQVVQIATNGSVPCG